MSFTVFRPQIQTDASSVEFGQLKSVLTVD